MVGEFLRINFCVDVVPASALVGRMVADELYFIEHPVILSSLTNSQTTQNDERIFSDRKEHHPFPLPSSFSLIYTFRVQLGGVCSLWRWRAVVIT